MALQIVFNPFTGKFDYINSPSVTVNIPEVLSDPVAPTVGETWVLFTPPSATGTPIGLLLALTRSDSMGTYQLSYHTTEDTVVRTILN